MLIVYSKNDVPVRLTIERWNHIISRHPELEGQKEQVMQTVNDPDLIQEGDFGELFAIRFYKTTPLKSKYLVIIYKKVMNSDGFVITAYYTAKLSERRKTIWKG